jgi:ATP-dependent helicase/DNAse subunit B
LVGEFDRLINAITIFVEQDLKENTDFIPHSLELDFSKNELPLSVLTKVDSHSTYLEGIIDRVDVSNAGNSFRVIDYKAGKYLTKAELISLIKDGQRFQPLIYSAVVEHIYGSLKDYSYYFVLGNGSKNIKKASITLNEKIDDTNITLRNISTYYVELYLNWIYSGRFHLSPRECPSYCEFINVCRVDKVLTDLKQKESPFWPEVDEVINDLEKSS